MWPAAAKSRSISPARLPDIDEKTSRGPLPGTHSSTVRPAAVRRRRPLELPGGGLAVASCRRCGRSPPARSPRTRGGAPAAARNAGPPCRWRPGCRPRSCQPFRSLPLPASRRGAQSTGPAVGGPYPYSAATASRRARLATLSPGVWATWMLPGPSRKGSPQAPRRGMSVVYLTMVVSKPGSEPRRTAGVSRISAIRTPGTAWTASESRRLSSAAVAHRADRHLGPGLVGDHVGGPAAGEGADVERRLAEDRDRWGAAGSRSRARTSRSLSIAESPSSG